LNWYKKASRKETKDLIFDVYKHIENIVGGRWIVKSSTKPVASSNALYSQWLNSLLEGRNVVQNGDEFYVKIQTMIKRFPGKVMHPEKGTYTDPNNWDSAIESPIDNLPDTEWEEELKRRWHLVTKQMIPYNSSYYDSDNGNPVISMNVIVHGRKPSATKGTFNPIQSAFGAGDYIKLGSLEVKTPYEVSIFVKQIIQKFYFGGDDGGEENEPSSPTPQKVNVPQMSNV
jgi:hypothetical protein